MTRDSRELRRTMPALIASIPIAIVFFAVLGIILIAAGPRGLALSDERTSGWIAVVYGLPMLPTLVLSIRYRQPLILTGNIFAIIFFVSLGDQIAFADLAGASLVAGALGWWHLRGRGACLPADPQVGALGRRPCDRANILPCSRNSLISPK